MSVDELQQRVNEKVKRYLDAAEKVRTKFEETNNEATDEVWPLLEDCNQRHQELNEAKDALKAAVEADIRNE